MEVTTVSPSPASPTEGDNLCDTDVTRMAIHSVTLLICLCGLVGNGAFLWLSILLSHTIAIIPLALASFLFLLFTVPSAFLFLVEDVSCSVIKPQTYMSLFFQVSGCLLFVWLFRLYLSSVSMFKLCGICFHCELPLRLLLVVYSAQFYVVFDIFIIIGTLSSLCPSHKQGHCQAGLISIYAVIVLLFFAPKFISHAINIIKARWGSKKQKPSRQHIVMSLVVLFTLLLSLCIFLQQLGLINLSTQVVFLLTCIHSTMKPFIYFLAGSCWGPLRSFECSLQRGFKEKKEKTASSDDAPRDTGV